jgi:predicted nucleic acid-binding protein
VKAVDATFPVDMLNALRPAALKAKALDESGEQLAIPAPALAEFMVGAEFIGGAYLEGARRLAAQLIVIDSDEAVALEAGRLGAELMRRGLRMAAADLLIAATCKLHQLILITRDEGFGRVPGLAVESY